MRDGEDCPCCEDPFDHAGALVSCIACSQVYCVECFENCEGCIVSDCPIHLGTYEPERTKEPS